MRKEAEGIRDSTKTKADGEAYQAKVVGEGTAAAYKAQVTELGQDNIAMLNIVKGIADGKIVITPNVLVQGGEGGSTANLLGAFLATKLAAGSKQEPAPAKK